MTELYDIFTKENHLKPDFDKTEFATLDSWDFGWAILAPINSATDKESEIVLSKSFSPGQKALYFFWYLDSEVSNGGFIQFYWNQNRKYIAPVLKGLKLIGDTEMIKLVEEAEKLFLKHQSKFELEDTQENFDKVYNELVEFEELDLNFFDIHDNTMDLIEKYIRENVGEFVSLK